MSAHHRLEAASRVGPARLSESAAAEPTNVFRVGGSRPGRAASIRVPPNIRSVGRSAVADCASWSHPTVWFRPTVFALIAVLAFPAASWAAVVDVELATESGFPATAARAWYELLTELNVDALRIRGAKAGDEPAIVAAGSEASPVYRVTGVLTKGNQLLLPGGKFSTRDRGRLGEWLTQLREQGPERVEGGKPLPFGLPSKQLAQVREDLAQTVDISTKGLSPLEALDKIRAGLAIPATIDRGAAAALSQAVPITEELRGMASGSAVAYLLRSPGLVLEPGLDARREPAYVVKPANPDQPAWPVGWATEAPARKVLPAMFELLDVEIEETLAATLEAIGERLETPILFDHYALARHGIEPAKVKVSIPATRTSYSIVLRKALAQGGLKSELRQDEAGRPLLWVTTLKRAQ